MMMRPSFMRIRQKGGDRILVAGRVMAYFAALANATVRLDMRTGRDFLQIQRDWLGAFRAFEAEGAGGFVHGRN
jgi:hypothetical protein